MIRAAVICSRECRHRRFAIAAAVSEQHGDAAVPCEVVDARIEPEILAAGLVDPGLEAVDDPAPRDGAEVLERADARLDSGVAEPTVDHNIPFERANSPRSAGAGAASPCAAPDPSPSTMASGLSAQQLFSGRDFRGVSQGGSDWRSTDGEGRGAAPRWTTRRDKGVEQGARLETAAGRRRGTRRPAAPTAEKREDRAARRAPAGCSASWQRDPPRWTGARRPARWRCLCA